MQKRPLCQIVCFFFISFVGIYHMRYIPICIALVLILFVALLVEHVYKKQYQYLKIKIILIFLVLFFGGVLALGQRKAQQRDYHAFSDKVYVTYEGTVLKKEPKKEQYDYYLKNCYIQNEKQSKKYSKLILVLNQDNIQIGKHIKGTAVVHLFHKARNEGGFDEDNYYKSIGIALKLQNKTIKNVDGNINLYEETLYQLKKKLLDFYMCSMPKKEAGVLSVMLLGDNTYLDSDIKALYQKMGISHILSISGLHISVIGMGIFCFFRKIGRSYFLSGFISSVFVFSFGMMSGFHIAAQRAVFMFLLSMFAKVIGRTYDAITGLSLAAIFTIVAQPYYIDYMGFLFSYFAVIGILVVASVVQQCMKEPHKVRDMILASISIQCMIMPLVAYTGSEIPVYCIWINLLILPCMEVVLSVGIVGGLIGVVFPLFGKKVVWIVYFILHLYERVAKIFAALPGAVFITGKPSIEQMMAYYSCLALCILLVFLFRKKRILLVGLLLCGFILFLRPQAKFEIDVLDVGQGDGIYINMGKTTTVFIDGGSTSQKNVGRYTILPFLKSKGIKKIDYWFVSHGDADHISGLLEVLKSGYKIRYVVLANHILEDEAYKKIVEAVHKSNAKIYYMRKGDVLKDGKTSIKAIFPDEKYNNTDRNALSLVLLLQNDNFKALFTGDISSMEEKRILKNTNLPAISFYKAAHHGSKYSNSKEFLDQLMPQAAVISCSETNRYGHPGKEAIDHIKAEHTKIYYTMKQGQIKLSFDKKQDQRQTSKACGKKHDKKCEEQIKNFYVRCYLNPLEVHFYPVLK